METQRLQKEKWSEVHPPLLFIYMIQVQWGQLEKGPECLVLINHGSRRAIIYVQLQCDHSSPHLVPDVLRRRWLQVFVCTSSSALLSKYWEPSPWFIPGLVGPFQHFLFSSRPLCEGNSKKGKKPTLCLPMRGWWAQRERGSWCSWYWSPNSTQCNNLTDGQKLYEIVHI